MAYNGIEMWRSGRGKGRQADEIVQHSGGTYSEKRSWTVVKEVYSPVY